MMVHERKSENWCLSVDMPQNEPHDYSSNAQQQNINE
jgi:hypothetical protein